MENQHVINMLGITNQQVYNNRRDINNLMELWTSTRDQLSGGSGRTPVYNPMISNLDGGGFSITNIQDLVAKGSGTFGGTLTVSGATSLGGSLTVTGITNLNNNLNVTGTTTISNITPANGTGSGAHVVQGGASVTLDFYIGQDLNVIGNSILTGTLDVSGITTINNNTLSTNSTNGALLVIGGVGIGENLNVGGSASVTGTLIVSQATTLGSTLSVGSNATITGTLTVIGATTLGNLTVTTLNATSTAVATNTSTGSITTLGGIGIAKNVQIGQDLNVIGASSLAETTCSGHLKIITGTSGANVDVINQENGSIHFTNGDSTSPVPNIVGKSITNTGLVILTSTPDVPASGKDIQFNVVNNSNTSHIDTTQTAYSFNVANNEKLGIIRNGAISVSGSYGTSGQVLSSNGNTGPPTWVDPAAGGTEIVATNNLVAKLGTAGTNLTSGYENILLGLNAGNAVTTGYRNVFISSNAGNKITTGYNNICLGNNSGTQTNTSVNNLISIGSFAGGSGSGGNNSISIGGSAGYQHVAAGSINIGSEAGKHYASYTDGAGAINIGGGSGRNQSKANSVNIGSESGYSNNSAYAVNIGRRAGYARSGASSINLGSLSNETNITTHDRAIVINASGVNVPSVADDTFVVKPIRNATGSNALFYDATSGEITYDTAGGGATAIVATENIITPDLGAGPSLTSSAQNNIFIGKNTGTQVSTADYNVAIGFNSLDANQSGGVYIGKDVCSQSGAGSTNFVGIGYETGRRNYGEGDKVFIGTQAGYWRGGSSRYNIGIGYKAGFNGRGGSSNQALVAIGQNAASGKNTNITSSNSNDIAGGDIIAIGNDTHRECRPAIQSSIFIGTNTGRETDVGATGRDMVAIGHNTLFKLAKAPNTINNYSTVVGALACNQGIDQSVSEGGLFLGYGAGQNNAYGNQIVLNGTGSAFDPTTNEGLFVKPIRNATGSNALFYDSGSGEITYDTASSGGTELLATNNLVSKLDTATSLTTGTNNIILGNLAGKSITTHKDNVFIGHQAGFNATINRGVAIGFEAGENGMGTSAICIGQAAGRNNAGNFSIHIGFGAGNQGNNYGGCVVIVGGASTLNPNGANRCFMKPIRGVAHGLGVGVMKYDHATSEITYSTN